MTSMTQKNLLIIESDPQTRQRLETELNDFLQMNIIVATDGVQAYQKTKNQKFTAVLCEPNMVKIFGRQLLDALREKDENAQLPILIHTEDIVKAKIMAANLKQVDFAQKPIETKKLADKLTALMNQDPTKKIFKLDVDFINPFIDSAVETLNKICDIDNIKALKPYLLGEETLDIDISGTLQIKSPYFHGLIAVSFNDQTYTKVVEQMLKKEIEGITAENQDGAAEIINIIFGQTKKTLNTKGYTLERAVPSVLRGAGHKIQNKTQIPVLLVPFNFGDDRFWVQICVRAT